MQKCLGHPTAEEEEGNLCSSPFLALKGRKKEGFTLGFRLLRLCMPFPLHSTLLTDKQAGRSHCSTAASWAAGLSLVIKITYLPAGREPAAPSLPWCSLGHCALLSLLKLTNSHLETLHPQHQESSEAMRRPVTVNYIIHYEALSLACESGFCQTHG